MWECASGSNVKRRFCLLLQRRQVENRADALDQRIIHHPLGKAGEGETSDTRPITTHDKNRRKSKRCNIPELIV